METFRQSMTKEGLGEYIKQQIALGHSEENIRQHLISFGHDIRKIDTAIEGITKPKPRQVQVGPRQAVKKTLKERELSIADYLTMWVRVFVSPTAIFTKERTAARLPNSMAHLAIAGVFGGLIGGLITVISTIFTGASTEALDSGIGISSIFGKAGALKSFSHILVYPLVAILLWISFSALLHFFSLAIGGKKSFRTHSHLIAISMAPIVLLLAMVSAIPNTCVIFIAYLIAGMMWFYPLTIATKVSHGFDTVKAILAWAIPMIVIVAYTAPYIVSVFATIAAAC
jgi:hypothetical protein